MHYRPSLLLSAAVVSLLLLSAAAISCCCFLPLLFFAAASSCCYPRCRCPLAVGPLTAVVFLTAGSLTAGSLTAACGDPFLWDRFRASPGACKVPSKRARRHADAARVHAFLKPPWCRPAHAIPDAPLQELPNALMDSDLPFPTPPSANPAL